jgi:hypothetical protein
MILPFLLNPASWFLLPGLKTKAIPDTAIDQRCHKLGLSRVSLKIQLLFINLSVSICVKISK